MFVFFLTLTPAAQAFCGTYVGTDGSPVHNRASQVVVATDGSQTVLTLANDYDGDAAAFGLIIPVPSTVVVEDITVTTRDALDTLDLYSAPRLVAYTCEDVVWVPGETGGWEDLGPGGSSSGCGGSSSSPEFSQQSDSGTEGYETGGGLGSGRFARGASSEHFTAGEYELDLVDAAGPRGLQVWLDASGFMLPEGADAVLAEAVTAGASFLVARVVPEAVSEERTWLSPIQIRYDGTEMVLPIRLGATASEGEQDILVYGIGPSETGALAIANYPSFTVDTHCLIGDDLAGGYEALFTEAYAAAAREGRAGWTLEFLSEQGVCDPLPPDGPIESSVLAALGFAGGIENATLSRLHVRGSPGEIDQDLVLYASGLNSYWQQDYIQSADHMDAYFRECGASTIVGEESCPEPDYDPPSTDDAGDADVALDDDDSASSSLCASGMIVPLLLFSAAALRRRRV